MVAVCFELVKHLFGSVMAMTDFAVIYGTYAAVPLFLISIRRALRDREHDWLLFRRRVRRVPLDREHGWILLTKI